MPALTKKTLQNNVTLFFQKPCFLVYNGSKEKGNEGLSPDSRPLILVCLWGIDTSVSPASQTPDF